MNHQSYYGDIESVVDLTLLPLGPMCNFYQASISLAVSVQRLNEFMVYSIVNQHSKTTC